MISRREFLTITGLGGAALLAIHALPLTVLEGKEDKIMAYNAKDYSNLIGTEGFSETLLKNHFTLYQGYVTNTNKVIDTLTQMLKDGKTATSEYAELKRRLGWEFNGMRLHEYYFENLGGKSPSSPQNPPIPPLIKGDKGGFKWGIGEIKNDGKLAKKLTDNFGSYELWEKDFKSTGTMRGIGWVVLYQDITYGRLLNFWINEHDVSHPSGCNPILIMDVFEHAYMVDYGLKKADYIESFFKNVNWAVAESRLK